MDAATKSILPRLLLSIATLISPFFATLGLFTMSGLPFSDESTDEIARSYLYMISFFFFASSWLLGVPHLYFVLSARKRYQSKLFINYWNALVWIWLGLTILATVIMIAIGSYSAVQTS